MENTSQNRMGSGALPEEEQAAPSERKNRQTTLSAAQGAEGETAPAQSAAGADSGAQPPPFGKDPQNRAAGLFGVQENSAVKARLPRRATLTDKYGARIGKLRRGVWYGEEGEERGFFREEGEGVLFYPAGEEEAAAYLDGNGNLLGAGHIHIATLNALRLFPLLVFVLLLAAVTVLSALLAAGAVRPSQGLYAPTIFVTDEGGTSWEAQSDLKVFFNERFGDSVIVPGMHGAYRFVFENRNADAVEFSLAFAEENEYGIELVYRLERDGVYVSGAGGYVGVEELGVSGMTVEAHSATVFELQWFWRHNDAADTAAGEAEASYLLHIALQARLAA